MAFPRKLNELCTPSLVYFVISVVAMLIIAFQNIGNTNLYCVANMSCIVPSTVLVFIIKALYILFWTWLLNLMCRDGQKAIAWFLVLFPFVMYFLILMFTMVNKDDKDVKEEALMEGAVGAQRKPIKR